MVVAKYVMDGLGNAGQEDGDLLIGVVFNRRKRHAFSLRKFTWLKLKFSTIDCHIKVKDHNPVPTIVGVIIFAKHNNVIYHYRPYIAHLFISPSAHYRLESHKAGLRRGKTDCVIMRLHDEAMSVT